MKKKKIIYEEDLIKEFFSEGAAVRCVDEWGTRFFVRVTKDSIELYEPIDIYIPRDGKLRGDLEYLANNLERNYQFFKEVLGTSFLYSSRQSYREFLKKKIKDTKKAAVELGREILDWYGEGCGGEECESCEMYDFCNSI